MSDYLKCEREKVKVIWLIRIAATILVLVAGIYFAVSNRSFDSCYDYIKSFDAIKPVEFEQEDILEQTMVFTMNQVNSIGICIVDQTNGCTGEMKIAIVDNNKTIWQESVDIENLQIKCITWLDVRQDIELQKDYILRISADEMTGTLYVGVVDVADCSDIVKENATRNGEQLSAPIVVEAIFRTQLELRMRIIILVWAFVVAAYLIGLEQLFLNKKRSIVTLILTIDIVLISIYFRAGFVFAESLNYVMFAGLVAAFLIVAVIYIFMLFKDIDKVELYFVVSTLVFGIVYSVILPPYCMPDEGFHFAQAYRLSNAVMGQPVNDESGYIFMRECDINAREYYPNNAYTIDMIKALIRGDNDRTEIMMPSENLRIANVPVIMYVPQSIGITIGRLLHVNYARLLYAARFMNLFMFTFAVYWAIKIIPCGKWIFFAICQIPMLLETVSSCSYDTPILAVTFLFVAYLLKLCVQTEMVRVRQMQILAGIAFVMAPLKPVYAPLTALVFLIPDENISSRKRKGKLCKLIVIVAAAVSVFTIYKFSLGSMSQIRSDNTSESDQIAQNEASDVTSDVTVEEFYQIDNNKPYRWPSLEYMIENPFNLVESLMGSYIVYAEEYWMAMIGCGLGALWDLKNPAYMGILTLLVLCISYRKDNGRGNAIVDLWGKLWISLMVAGSLFGIFLAMYLSYSEPSGKVIGGVQGRYMLPLLIVLPFFLRKKEYPNGRTKTTIIMLSLTVQILVILNTSMQIWNR